MPARHTIAADPFKGGDDPAVIAERARETLE